MRQLKLAVPILAALALIAGPARAADEEKGFDFHLDSLDFGVQMTDLDTDSAKFEEYRDQHSGFVIPHLALSGESKDGNRTFNFVAANVRRDDARYTLDYGVAGRYGVTLDYNKIPHRFGNDGRTLFARTGPGRYEISDGVQAALQGGIERQFATAPAGVTFAFLDNLIRPFLSATTGVSLGLQRDRTRALVELGKSAAVAWNLEYTHENRVGTRPFGASFGFNNVTELPEPIDYDTTGGALSGEWGGKKASLSFGYRYSKFENNIGQVIWDNPFRVTSSTDPGAYSSPGSGSINGSNLGLADLAPDNRASTLFLSGRANLGARGWANGSATFTQMKQDDKLLPYTLNSAIKGINFNGSAFDPTNPANLPEAHADNKVDVTAITGNAGTKLGDRFDLSFHYRFYDYNNKSKRIEFPGYVRFQAVWEPIERITVPYAYTRQDVGADFAWNLTSNTDLTFTYNRQSWDREFREVKTSDEDVFKVSLDSRPNDKLTLRAGYEHGDRSIGHYEPEAAEATFVEPEGVTNIPLLRKFDEAARKSDLYNASLLFTPNDKWSFQVGLRNGKDDYDESAFGLQSDEVHRYNLELDFTPGENHHFYLWGELADRKSLQRSRQSGATPSTNPLDDWGVTLKERNDDWGLGWTSKPAPRWTLDLSAHYDKSDGSADFFAFAGGLPLGGNPPRTSPTDIGNYEDYKLAWGELKVDYALTSNTTAGFLYRYEDYTIDSFITQGLLNYLPGALLINANNGDYTGSVYGLLLKVSL